jgi:hypothetical protein
VRRSLAHAAWTVALVASLIAGCATGAPPVATPSATTVVSATPTAAPATPSAAPSGPLDELLPTTLGGQPLAIASASGAAVTELFPNGDLAELAATMDGINSTVDALALSLASSPSVGSEDANDILVAVFQVEGVHWTPYSAHLRRLVGSLLGPVPGHILGTPIVSGRNPTSILDPANPDDQTYLYILREDVGDVVYFVNGAYPLVEELFSTLPEGG